MVWCEIDCAVVAGVDGTAAVSAATGCSPAKDGVGGTCSRELKERGWQVEEREGAIRRRCAPGGGCVGRILVVVKTGKMEKMESTAEMTSVSSVG